MTSLAVRYSDGKTRLSLSSLVLRHFERGTARLKLRETICVVIPCNPLSPLSIIIVCREPQGLLEEGISMISVRGVCFCIAVGLAIATATGCMSTKPAYSTYDPYAVRPAYGGAKESTGSLFPSDQAVLSNEDIERILSAGVVLPAQPRLAVMKVGTQQRYWSEDSPILDRDTTEAFLESLRQSPCIAYAAALPGILVPERLGVPYLREAAARFQADLLLVYRVETGSYEKYRSIREDQMKAYCTVEAAILDVRSGTVPFTTVAFEQVQAARTEDDLNFRETMDRAYHDAEGAALQQIAASARGFLESVESGNG